MRYLILFLSLFVSVPLFADVSPAQMKEVTHLLNFVKNSSCIMNRNGSDHKGEKAVKHIKNKYDYFRDDIKTTEDFIKYSATKSTMSGKYYKIACPGKKIIRAETWLLDELKHYREADIELAKNKVVLKVVICKDPRPQVCTMQYLPVCTTLKDKSVKTYASGCSACSDANVLEYKTGACE